MLLSFPPARDADASVSRIALIRNRAEAGRIAGEIAKRENAKGTLAAELEKLPQAEHDRDAALDQESRTLVSKLMGGLGAALSAFGKTAEEIDLRIAKSRHAAAVGQRALSRLDGEIADLKAQLAELESVRPELIAATTAEACQDVVDSYQDALARMQESMIRLSALERFLRFPRPARVVAVVPDFNEADFNEQVVVANNREITKAHEALTKFADALSHDARAPASLLNFPPIDTSLDSSEFYSMLSKQERDRIDATAKPPATRQKVTPDSEMLAEQIRVQQAQFEAAEAERKAAEAAAAVEAAANAAELVRLKKLAAMGSFHAFTDNH